MLMGPRLTDHIAAFTVSFFSGNAIGHQGNIQVIYGIFQSLGGVGAYIFLIFCLNSPFQQDLATVRSFLRPNKARQLLEVTITG